MHSHWSLVFFTLAVQSVVGHIWCIQAALFLGGCRPDSPWLKYQIFLSLGMLLPGLAVSVTHLGSPAASIHAVRNIRHSWLSREIAAVNLFACSLAAITVFLLFNPGELNPWIVTGESLIGVVTLFAMTRVYLLRTVPSWNHIRTLLSFLGSALILGAVLFVLSFSLQDMMTGPGPGAKQLAVSRYIAFGILSAGLMLSVLAAAGHSWKRALDLKPACPPVIQTAGFGLWAFSLAPGLRPETHLGCLFPAAVLLVAGEVFHRIKFYNNYQRLGL